MSKKIVVLTGSARTNGNSAAMAEAFIAAARAKADLLRAQEGLSAGLPPDLLLSDVEQALEALGELTGASVREDITARIFSRFCVGK